MQYFASFEPFEIFEEFNGVPGTYIKSFLISDKINLNNWQATHEANISNLKFICFKYLKDSIETKNYF